MIKLILKISLLCIISLFSWFNLYAKDELIASEPITNESLISGRVKDESTANAHDNNKHNINKSTTNEHNDSCCEHDQKEILVCGISPDNAPYEYIDENGDIIGIEVEIIKIIAEKLNMQLEIKNIDFSGLITAILAKNIDIAISNITKTDARKKVVDFSKSYLNSQNALFYLDKHHDEASKTNLKNQDAISNLLAGKVVGAQNGTTWFDYANSLQNNDNFSLKGLPSNVTLVQEIKNTNIDYLILDELQAGFICKQVPNTKFLVIPNYTIDKKAIVFQKDSELKAKVNKILKEMLKSGIIDEIIKKYNQ